MPDEKIDQKRPVQAESELKKMQQRLVDDTVDDSFPASDPPAWTTGGSKSVAARSEGDRDERNDDRTGPEGRARRAVEGLTEQASHLAQSARRTGERYLDEARRHWPEAERYYRQGRQTLARPVESYPLAAVFVAALAGYSLALLIHGRASSPRPTRRNLPAYGKRPRPGPYWDDETQGDPDLRGVRQEAMAASRAPSSY